MLEEEEEEEEEEEDSMYPMYFGVTCALVALELLSAMEEPNAELSQRKFSVEELMLRGSAQLLGLMFEKAQRRREYLQEKEKRANLEVMELRLIRAEDAKANEKVVSIFSGREQGWKTERRRLLNQIHSLSCQLSLSKFKNEEIVSALKKRVSEEQKARMIKDDVFEKEAKMRADLEEKFGEAQKAVEELKEKASKESQDHNLQVRKHKAALSELISKQRQIEAEAARLLLQVDAAKLELDEVFEQKEEALAMVEKLSEEFLRVQKDAEQKGMIVSAMLRKAQYDTAEKQELLKEVKLTRAKNKQSELEAERWKTLWEEKQRKTKFPRDQVHSADAGSSGERIADLQSGCRLGLRARLIEYLTEGNREHEFALERAEGEIKTVNFQVQYLDESDENFDTAQELGAWVRLETKKCTSVLEQRHYSEIEAFAEQLRERDEKLEALHWRLLSAELDSKRLQSHIEELDGRLFQLRDENLKLEERLCGKRIPLEDRSNDSFPSMNLSEDQSNDEFSSEDRFPPLGEAQPLLKMDIQAVGVSFKIKRLKHQLFILENLAGDRDKSSDNSSITGKEKKVKFKGLMQVISLLNKQLKRHQSLEGKIDSLFRKMQLENSREKTDKLEQFLEEAFHLQRFMVATGQKLTETQSKISSSLSSVDGQDESAGFNLRQFLDVVRTLFKEVQRGLEVRIARIIGDIEGTLAIDGILNS